MKEAIMAVLILVSLFVAVGLLVWEADQRQDTIIRLKQQIQANVDLNKQLSDQISEYELRYLTGCKCLKED